MLKKYTLLFILILFLSNIFAQDTIDIGLAICKPTLIFSNFFRNYYEKKYDSEIRITIHKSKNFVYGSKFNFGYYQNEKATVAYNLRPKLFIGYKNEPFHFTKLYLIFSLGYSNVQLNNAKYNYKENFSGINADIEFQYELMTKYNIGIYAFLNWEHSYFFSDNFSKLQYFKHSNIIMYGIGLKYQISNKKIKNETI